MEVQEDTQDLEAIVEIEVAGDSEIEEGGEEAPGQEATVRVIEAGTTSQGRVTVATDEIEDRPEGQDLTAHIDLTDRDQDLYPTAQEGEWTLNTRETPMMVEGTQEEEERTLRSDPETDQSTVVEIEEAQADPRAFRMDTTRDLTEDSAETMESQETPREMPVPEESQSRREGLQRKFKSQIRTEKLLTKCQRINLLEIQSKLRRTEPGHILEAEISARLGK